MPSAENILKSVEILVSIIGFAFIYWGIAKQRKAIQAQSSVHSAEVYLNLFAKAPRELDSTDNTLGFEGIDLSTRDECIAIGRSYFGLLFVENALYRDGSLSRRIWEEWEAVAVARFQSRIWRDIWAEIRKEIPASTIRGSEFARLIDGLAAKGSRSSRK
jgi:hypothetical protein